MNSEFAAWSRRGILAQNHLSFGTKEDSAGMDPVNWEVLMEPNTV